MTDRRDDLLQPAPQADTTNKQPVADETLHPGSGASPASMFGAGAAMGAALLQRKIQRRLMRRGQGVVAPHAHAAGHADENAPAAGHIDASVGEGGVNASADVHAVQTALAAAGTDPGHADGKYGPATHHAIVAFQQDIGLHPDGLVEPGKKTEQHMFDGAAAAHAAPAQPATSAAHHGSPTPHGGDHSGPAPTTEHIAATPAPNATPAADSPAGPATTAPVTTPTATATTAATAVAPATTSASGAASITETQNHQARAILRPDEMFAATPSITDSKKHAFNHLNKAWSAVRAAEARLSAARDATAKVDATEALATAQADVATATDEVQGYIVRSRLASDAPLKALKAQLAAAKKSGDAASIAEIKTTLTNYQKTRTAELKAEVAAMKHTDPGHADESVFAPESADVVTHNYSFDDGQTVSLTDHAVSYATTSMTGVNTEGTQRGAVVEQRMGEAGLSTSNQRILKMISGFEGGFDATNTYDRAVLTWGFVQWTGGNASDLTAALTQIKAKQPDAFQKQFVRYGIDVAENKLHVTMSDGTVLKGDAAAHAVQNDPKLAAILTHAGRDENVQKGEVQAAVALEITKALDNKLKLDGGKTVSLGHIMRSEYGVGLLANTYVHSGAGAATRIAKAAVHDLLDEHPYEDGDDWAKLAEAAIIEGLAEVDGDRAAAMGEKLDKAWGSYKP